MNHKTRVLGLKRHHNTCSAAIPTAGLPRSVKVMQLIVLNTDFLDYVCLGNEKDLMHLAGK